VTPTFADILAARDVVASHLPATPMWSYPALDDVSGAHVYVKHENVQPTGAFKVRGGLALLASMTAAQRRRGIVSYSTGNHAQSLAYASAVFGAACTIVMPEGTSAEKIRGVRGFGATVELYGRDLADAHRRAEQLGQGAALISPGDTPQLLAGVGSLYLEIFESDVSFDAVVVPVGSGTGAAAACLVAAKLAPGCRVVAVQSAAAPAAHDSWRSGTCVARPIGTAVDGLATGTGYAVPQEVLRRGLTDFRLVSDEAIMQAQRLLATHAHTLAEGAGSAAVAALLAEPDGFAGRTVCVVCTGGNASAAEIAALA
jgi:threonine dehydratase